MSDNVKIKLCPWCGGEAEKPYVSDTRCKDPECPAHYFVTWMPYKVWQQRPLEDALRAERDRAVQMVAKLIEAGNAMAGAFRLIAKLNSMGYSGPMYVWHALVDEWKEQK